MELAGISRKVDSCAGLIAQKAIRAYHHLPEVHKRWIDPEDLLQEGLLAAYIAEQQHKDNQQSKYSTYLYRALDWKNSKVHTRVHAQKRDVPGILELDRPIEGAEGQRFIDVRDPKPIELCRELDIINSFMAVFHVVGQKAKATLLRAFAFGDTRLLTKKVAKELRSACNHHNVSFEDLKRIQGDERIVKRLLTRAAWDGTLEEGTEEEKLKLLVCTECGSRFSLESVRAGRFWVSTMTCRSCYLKLAKQRHKCFGKGFDEKLAECRLHCQDRGPCKQLVRIRGKDMTDLLEGVDLAAAEQVAEKEKTVKAKAKSKPVEKKTKKVKPSKPAKTKKKVEKPEKRKKKAATEPKKSKATKEKVDGEAPPKELVVWPYRPGTMFFWMFRQMYRPGGIGQAELRKKLAGKAQNIKYAIKHLCRFNHRNHSWKVNDEDGRYQIYAVKYKPDNPDWKKH